MKSANSLIGSLLIMGLAAATIATVRAEGAPVPVRVPPPPPGVAPAPTFTIVQPGPEAPTVTLPEPAPDLSVAGPILPGISESEPAQPRQPMPTVQATPGRATFIIYNDDRYTLGVEFYSETRRGWSWPGNGREYTLGKAQTYTLTCNTGEQICAGAWRDNQTVSWGVGHGNRGCHACCAVCGGPAVEMTLNDGGPDSFASQNSGGQDMNQVIGLISAVVEAVAGSDLVGPGCQTSWGC
jgi:hypothetical protein